MDDPHAIVFANPPTYPGAYEKFFETGGRFQWAEPECNVFDAPVDVPKLRKLFDGRKALPICRQRQTPGNAATDSPVHARRPGPDSVVYMNSNRPNEVRRFVGGDMATVAPSKSAEMPIPISPRDHRITERSEIKVVPLRDSAAQDSYPQVMRHGISGNVSPMCVPVPIDGHVAGIIGHGSPNPMYTIRHAVLRQAFGASHERHRLAKPVTMMALRRSTFRLCATPKTRILVDACDGPATVEHTRYPEARGLRGLMKPDRRDRKNGRHQLRYKSDCTTSSCIR